MAPKKETKVTEQPVEKKETKAASTKAETKSTSTKSKAPSTKEEKPATSTKVEKKQTATKSASTKGSAKSESTKAEAAKSSTEQSEEPVSRRKATKETIDGDFESIFQRIEDEIKKLEERKKTEKGKVTGIQFLKQLRKLHKNLHRDTTKVLKIKKTNRVASETSGFKKPVKISDEMCKFFGWDNTKLYSRTDVTREICKYITDNKLQDTVNKRIINPNAALIKLLDYKEKEMPVDAKTGKHALYYYCLQKLLTRHFPKPASATK